MRTEKEQRKESLGQENESVYLRIRGKREKESG